MLLNNLFKNKGVRVECSSLILLLIVTWSRPLILRYICKLLYLIEKYWVVYDHNMFYWDRKPSLGFCERFANRFVFESDVTSLYKLCNMATDHISELVGMENSDRTSRSGFCSNKYSLLVIVGLPGPAGFVDLLVTDIERGKVFLIIGWDWIRARLARQLQYVTKRETM